MKRVKIGDVEMKDLVILFADAAIFHSLDMEDKPTVLLGMNAMQAFNKISMTSRASSCGWWFRSKAASTTRGWRPASGRMASEFVSAILNTVLALQPARLDLSRRVTNVALEAELTTASVTTLVIGEEDPPITTMALGEETPPVTTMAVGEENPPSKDQGYGSTERIGEEEPPVTTLPVNEEDNVITTLRQWQRDTTSPPCGWGEEEEEAS